MHDIFDLSAATRNSLVLKCNLICLISHLYDRRHIPFKKQAHTESKLCIYSFDESRGKKEILGIQFK